jgi:hypothetical protein
VLPPLLLLLLFLLHLLQFVLQAGDLLTHGVLQLGLHSNSTRWVGNMHVGCDKPSELLWQGTMAMALSVISLLQPWKAAGGVN